MLPCDKYIANCLEPHPDGATLAASGIEQDVKIFCPTGEPRQLSARIRGIIAKNLRRRPAPILTMTELLRRFHRGRFPAGGEEDEPADEEIEGGPCVQQ